MFNLCKLTKRWFWHEVKYTIRKILRFPLRVIEWSKIIFHDEDWDFSLYTLDLLEFKLQKMAKHLDKYSHHLYKDRDVKQIKEVIEHIKRYKDIDEYVLKEECNYWTEKTEDGYHRMKDDMSKHGKFLLKRSMDLEKWHWEEIWRKLSKYARGWWD